MIPPKFEYRRASSVHDAIEMLRSYGDDAKLLAGGHSLLPLMKLRLAAPPVLVDVGRLRELSYVRDEGRSIAIGALTRHHDVETSPALAEACPLLAHVAGQVGDPQVRHRGTIGGSLAHGDPAGDLPAVMLALDATIVVQGSSGTRTVPATSFFTGFLETALEADEILTEIRVPRTGRTGWSFQKFTRRAQDWAIVGVAALGEKVALVNMASTPTRAAAVEAALASGASPTTAAALASEGMDPPGDVNASPEFRRHLATVLVRRALEEVHA